MHLKCKTCWKVPTSYMTYSSAITKASSKTELATRGFSIYGLYKQKRPRDFSLSRLKWWPPVSRTQ